MCVAALALGLLAGCSDDSSADDDASGGSSSSGDGGSPAGGAGGAGGAAECVPTEVPCSDQVILTMNLKPDPAPGLITSEADGAGWLSFVDATAGGAFSDDPESFTYGRFTDAGLEKVNISDEQALAALDWAIAFRRYVVRINSGHSGSSCVEAARVPGTAGYDALTEVPDGLMYRADLYFTESCDLIPDGSGLENSPATALSSYWTYPGCVQMTGNVFVVRTAEGRRLKLVVTHYYNPEAQEQCDTQGSVPMSGADAANFRVRWAFLP